MLSAQGRTRPTATIRVPDAPVAPGRDISHRINAERLVLLGWGRAILLQLAHPLIAAGVYDHSSFRATTWSAATRLHATVRAMLALTFGTDAEREYALDGIRRIHRRVHGQLATAVGPFPAGTCYSAEDPSLVLWVHVTLLESVPLVYERFIAPISEADRDAYCAQAAWVALALGARPEDVPRKYADVRAHVAAAYASGAITVGPQARELAESVIAPRVARIIPPAAWLNRLVTVGLLPPHIREQYGFRWSARQQTTLERVVPLLKTTRRTLPDIVALWPEARG